MTNNQLHQAARILAAAAGRAGKGDCKRRGNREYYQRIRAMRRNKKEVIK